MIYAFKHFERFMRFVAERYMIAVRRRNGGQPPWTKDKILSQYKFTNVYREWDRVTIWIKEHWREPYEAEPHLWFAMVIARLVNHPPTLETLSLPGRWNKTQFLHAMHDRRAQKLKTFGSAYIVSTGGRSMDKAQYIADYVLDPLWNDRQSLCPCTGQTLASWMQQLLQYDGLGSFMSAQIIADMKYVAPLKNASDWWTFVSSGPGSRRGMSYVLGLDPRTKWREHEWRAALGELSVLTRPQIQSLGMPRLHAQDLQNCLCEYSKYRRTELGTGRPKQKFVPFTEEE